MELSVFAQYHLRKLLSRYVDNLSYPTVEGAGVQFNNLINLNRTLRRLTPDGASHTERVLELETLIRVYHDLEVSHLRLEKRVQQLEQRILQLLGLKTDEVVDALPNVLQEVSVHRFTFLREGEFQTGIQYKNDFYGVVREFASEDRLRAYRFAWCLMERGVECLITAADTGWVVWALMRSPVYPALIHQGTNRFDRYLGVSAQLA